MSKQVSIVILAAGAAKRFGTAKQLVQIDNTHLLQLMINKATESDTPKIYVILGANYQLIIDQLQLNKKTVVVMNETWEEGIASSIRSAVLKEMEENISDALLLTVCDQPVITTGLLNDCIRAYINNSAGIVATKYTGTIGTPALFDKKYYNDLLQLSGDTGAKKIITNHLPDVYTISFEGGSFDIDTPNDWQEFIKGQRS